MLFGFAADEVINGLVPEFLNTFPVVDLGVSQEWSNIMGSMLCDSIISDKEIQVWVVELILSRRLRSSLLQE